MPFTIVVDKKWPPTYICNHFPQKCMNIAYICLQTKERKKLKQLLRGKRKMWFLTIHALLVTRPLPSQNIYKDYSPIDLIRLKVVLV